MQTKTTRRRTIQAVPAALAAALGAAAVQAGQNPPRPNPAPRDQRKGEPPQPYMHEAMRDLRTAKQWLEKATSDHGGHRLKALDHVNQAMAEVQAGIDYKNAHG